MVELLKAKQLLLLGQFINEDEALRIGLLTEIHEDCKARAVEFARELAKLPRIASSSLKTSVERALSPNMEVVLHDEVNVASYCFAQSDAAKAFSNFGRRKSGQNDEGVKSMTTAHALAYKPEFNCIKDINTALGVSVRKFPNKTFLPFGSHDVTFHELNISVAALAGGVQKRGVHPGDRVLVMMRNSVEMVHTWMATNRLGATWVPINVELKSLTFKHVVEAANARLAIVDGEFYTELLFFHLYDHANAVDLDQAATVTPSTTAAFLYTSGTTGKSKPCILSHQYFILQATALIEAFKIHSDDVIFCPFPLFHADATALTVIPALLLGATAALSIRFSASRFWDEISEAKATVYDFMGATLALTYKQPPNERDRDHHVRLAWGVPIPAFAGRL
jgi:non-ribosomal peptide synthetase component F